MTTLWSLPIALLPTLVLAATFPNYDDPITAAPEIERPSWNSCAVVLVPTGTLLDDYNLVVRTPYDSSCAKAGPWTKAVLDFDGNVAGVQFDRYGALWVGGVELLRLTTPEPSPEGIAWHVERDVSCYMSYLLGDGLQSALSIPNTVDSTYTGVLNVSAKLTFYGQSTLENSLPTVLPLTDPAAHGSYPWDIAQVSGTSEQIVEATLPHTNVERAYLHVYASAHQCEEFWWSNLPNKLADEVGGGSCGGGTYRQLVAKIDGKIAGIALPFPVMYTGGVNPLLWRPLTGIMSFDVEPWIFDVTPFLGILNDGNAHNFSVSVVGNNDDGLWYLDQMLVLHRSATHKKLVGQVLSLEAFDPTVNEIHTGSVTPVLNLTVNTTGSVRYTAKGSLRGDGEPISAAVFTTVAHVLDAENHNTLSGCCEGFTNGSLHATSQSIATNVKGDLLRNETNTFIAPYQVWSYYSQTADNRSIEANITFARIRRRKVIATDTADLDATWSNEIDAWAVYNSSSSLSIQLGASKEVFSASNLGSDLPLCYNRLLEAVNGSILKDEGGASDETCAWPVGYGFNGGSEVVSTRNSAFEALSVRHTSRTDPPRRHRGVAEIGRLPFRSPLPGVRKGYPDGGQ